MERRRRRDGSAGVFQRQYVHWLGANARYADGRRSYDPRAQLVASDADPHAMAVQRILEPRFQEVLRRASVRGDGSVDGAMYQRCAKCHDPLGLTVPMGSRAEQTPLPLGEGGERSELGEGLQPRAATASNALTPALSRREREAVRGIGCESCHGGARDWIAVHYERGVSREQLAQLGMVDTKDLFVRARQMRGLPRRFRRSGHEPRYDRSRASATEIRAGIVRGAHSAETLGRSAPANG